jgi:hypothetical protein
MWGGAMTLRFLFSSRVYSSRVGDWLRRNRLKVLGLCGASVLLVVDLAWPALDRNVAALVCAVLLYDGRRHLVFSPHGAAVRRGLFIVVGILTVIRPAVLELCMMLALAVEAVYSGRLPDSHAERAVMAATSSAPGQ